MRDGWYINLSKLIGLIVLLYGFFDHSFLIMVLGIGIILSGVGD